MTTSLLLKSNRKLCLKVLFVFMTVILLLLASPAESHAAEIQVILDGTPVSFDDSTGYPFLDENDRTLVPMRAVMEACGCTVDWDGVNQVATVSKGNTEVKAVAGQSCIYRNNQKIANDSAAAVMNGRTYLPIRVVLESFGYIVKWDGANSSVTASSTFDASNTRKPEGYDEFWSNFDISTADTSYPDGATTLAIICVYHIDNEEFLKNFILSNEEKISGYCKAYLKLNQTKIYDKGSTFAFRIPIYANELRNVCTVNCYINPNNSKWDDEKLLVKFVD